jgi:predicted transposase YdaD
MDRINDLAFILDDRLVILIEHQSTINQNMALRLLLYIARVYEKIIDNKAMYRDKLIQIPRPEFYVLYNGKSHFPPTKTIRLKNSFKDQDTTHTGGLLDLEVTVVNVNLGNNTDLIQKSVTLYDYTIFVSKVREFISAKLSLEEAITKTIDYCTNHNILADFLDKHSREVRNMLVYEFDLDTAKEVWREEALEEGMEKGMEKGLQEGKEMGLQEGKEEGKVLVLAKLLSYKFNLPLEVCEKAVTKCSSEQLDQLTRSIFNISTFEEVEKFLEL